MSTPELGAAPPAADPFELGWRYVRRTLPDGTEDVEVVPLTERDLLYPEEDDKVVTNEQHALNCLYLRTALEAVTAGRPGVKVFMDHRIDFQVPDLHPLGPDLAVFDGVEGEWDPRRGTFPVADFNGRPLAVVEVTSPSTRRGDLDDKVGFYRRARVPVYVICDLQTRRGGEAVMTVFGYRLVGGRSVRAEPDADGVLWVPEVGAGFRPDGMRVVLVDAAGTRVPDHRELRQQVGELVAQREEAERRAAAAEERAALDKQRAEREAGARAEAERRAQTNEAQVELERARAEAERQAAAAERERAEAERQAAEAERERAEAERRRADLQELKAEAERRRADLQELKAEAERLKAEAERRRADQLAADMAALQAELRRLRGDTP